MESYRHTQRGGWVVWLGVVGVAMLIGGAVKFPVVHGDRLSLIFLGSLLIIIWWLFHSLTVTVSSEEVRVWFGQGLLRKSIPLSEIKSAQAVRNPWWFGWGIRFIPNGMMFNISGLDAVELKLSSGNVFRIGTDEPLRLMEALNQMGISTPTSLS